jgi:hypothetical protein
LTTKFTQHTQEAFRYWLSPLAENFPEHTAQILWAFDPAPRTLLQLQRFQSCRFKDLALKS